jgi:hypothetical protein
MTLGHISATMYMTWCKGQLWNVSVLQRVYLFNVKSSYAEFSSTVVTDLLSCVKQMDLKEVCLLDKSEIWKITLLQATAWAMALPDWMVS